MKKGLQNAMSLQTKTKRFGKWLQYWLILLTGLLLVEFLLLYPFAVWRSVRSPPTTSLLMGWLGDAVAFCQALPQIGGWICLPTKSLLRDTLLLLRNLWWINLLMLLLIVAEKRKRGDRPFSEIEQGSARWAGKAEYREFQPRPGAFPILDKVWIGPDNDLPNLHVISFGSTGSGKTFQSLIPRLLAQTGSYIAADVKGSLYIVTRHVMEARGYDVLVLNLKDPRFSDRFNPFAYCRTDSDITSLAMSFVLNSRADDTGHGDQFWEDSIRALFCAMAYYMLSESGENASLSRMLELDTGLEVTSEGIAPYCFFERKMKEREQDNPFDPAVVNYKIFRSGAPETLQSIIISLGMRLQLWVNEDLKMLTDEDDFHLRELAQSNKPTVVYLILPEKNETMKPISAMFIQTVFEVFSDVAQNVTHGKLPIHWSFLLDEFANLGKFPDIVSMLTLVRAYGINIATYLQSTQQLKDLYKDKDQTIIGNCAAYVYLGCNDPSVHKEISERLDKTTILNDSSSHAITGNGGDSESEQTLGRSLMTPGEVATKMKGRSIVFLPDRNPFIGDKIHTQELDGYDLLGREVDSKHQYAAYQNNRFVEEDYKDIYEARKAVFDANRDGALEEHRERLAALIAAAKEAEDAATGQQRELIHGFAEFERAMGLTDDPEPDTMGDLVPDMDPPDGEERRDLMQEATVEQEAAVEAEMEETVQQELADDATRSYLQTLKDHNRRTRKEGR